MDNLKIDVEVLEYLLNTIKNRIINDVEEGGEAKWKYLLAISECKMLAKEKHNLDIKIIDYSSDMLNLLINEFEENIK